MRKLWMVLVMVVLVMVVLLPLGVWSQVVGTRPNTESTHSTNLKMIGTAMAMYAAEYNDKVPPSMEILIASIDKYSSPPNIPIPPENTGWSVLAGPGVEVPLEVRTAKRAEQAAWLLKNGSYLVLGFGQRFGRPEATTTPLVIERPELDKSKPMLGVLYYDCHVEQRDRKEVEVFASHAAAASQPATTTKATATATRP